MRWARGKSASVTLRTRGFLLFLEDRWLDIRVFDVNVVAKEILKAKLVFFDQEVELIKAACNKFPSCDARADCY
jgi:hypothetical protein